MSLNADSSKKVELSCGRCAKILIYVGIVEAIIFIVLKITLGIVSGSRALIAASLYSVQDLISSLVAAFGLKVSAKPPDRDHAYGHGKIEYLVVVLMSVMILLGIIALAITALGSFLGEVNTTEPPMMLALWVSLVCGLSCWLLSRFQRCAGERLNSPALKSCADHMHGDYLASIAVVISVIAAKLGYPALDHIVAIVEAMHVIFISGRMLGTAVAGLMDTTADPQILEKLKRVARDTESVKQVSRIAARWSGQTLVAQTDIEVAPDMEVSKACEIRASIQRAVKEEIGGQNETLVRILPYHGIDHKGPANSITDMDMKTCNCEARSPR
jgi:cation diffusion facilitator family transporter